MWISLFTIVLTIALGLGLGAVMLESCKEETHRRRKTVWNLRPMRNL